MRSDKANLDEGRVWPTADALTESTADDEANIAELVKKALRRGIARHRPWTGSRQSSGKG